MGRWAVKAPLLFEDASCLQLEAAFALTNATGTEFAHLLFTPLGHDIRCHEIVLGHESEVCDVHGGQTFTSPIAEVNTAFIGLARGPLFLQVRCLLAFAIRFRFLLLNDLFPLAMIAVIKGFLCARCAGAFLIDRFPIGTRATKHVRMSRAHTPGHGRSDKEDFHVHV